MAARNAADRLRDVSPEDAACDRPFAALIVLAVLARRLLNVLFGSALRQHPHRLHVADTRRGKEDQTVYPRLKAAVRSANKVKNLDSASPFTPIRSPDDCFNSSV